VVFPVSASSNLFNIPADIASITLSGNATVNLFQLAAGSTFDLTDTGTSIQVGTGCKLRFNTNYTVHVAGDVSVGASAELNAVGTIEFGTAGGAAVTFSAAANSTIIMAGIGVGSLRLDSTGADNSTVVCNCSGSITFTGNNASLDGTTDLFTSLASQRYWEIRLGGSINPSGFTSLTLNASCLTITATTLTTGIVGNGAGFSGGGGATIGRISVASGSAFVIADGVFPATPLRVHEWRAIGSGNLSLGNNAIAMAGSRASAVGTAIDVASTASFSTSGLWTTADLLSAGQAQLLDGSFTLGGTLTVSTFDVLVALGATVTLAGPLTVNAGHAFGADEDGADSNGHASITYIGNVTLNGAAGLRLGEGWHSLFGNLNASSVANAVVAGTAGNNVPPRIMLTGVNQTLAFQAGTGSHFFITSVGANTRVTQTGRMQLGGPLDTTGAAGATPFTAFDGTAGTMVVGTGVSAVRASIRVGAGDVELNTLTVAQVTGANVHAFSRLEAVGTGVGVLRVNTLTLDGDTSDQAAGNDRNAAEADFSALIAEFGDGASSSTGLFVGAGSSSVGGFGARLYVRNGSQITTRTNGTLRIGHAGGTATESLAGGRLWASASTFTFQTGATFHVNTWSSARVTGSTLTGTGAWTFSTASTCARLHLIGTTITSAAANQLTINVAGADTAIDNCAISNTTAAGLSISGQLTSLSSTDFSNGQSGGAHITITASLTNGSNLDCDDNHFDDSVGYAGAGNLVNNNGANAPLTFRALTSDDFGIGGLTITDVDAETNGDNDGSAASEVRWSRTLATLLDVAPYATFSPEAQISAGNDENRTMVMFTATSTTGSNTITSIAVQLAFSGQLTLADIASVKLFNDGTNDGFASPAEVIAEETPPLAADVTFGGLAGQTINAAAVRHYGVVCVFDPAAVGKWGSIDIRVTSIVSNGLVTGRPISVWLPITGPAASMVLREGPDALDTSAVFPVQPVIELRDATGLLVIGDNSTLVEAMIYLGPINSTLGGVRFIKAVRGVATYTNLKFLSGGLYRLRFDNGIGGLTVTTELMHISGPGLPGGGGGGGGFGGGGGGGGCVTAPDVNPAAWWWLPMLLLGCAVWRRMRA
ncbi:MAG: beta strand repeat-containing protein, partial [Planctomycetota bacterium]